MAEPLRILVTGSRDWRDKERVELALTRALAEYASIGLPVLIHGGARGADLLADMIWRDWIIRLDKKLAEPEVYPARWFTTPLHRNEHMVGLGATVCLAFAREWASGTGHCARAARRAGIPTIDYGVPTDARPAKEARR